MRYGICDKWIDFIISGTTESATPSEDETSREDTEMSTPATMYQVDSALIRFVRLVLPVLICGLVAATLYATSIGRPQQAAADTPQVQGAATGSSEQPVSPPPSTTRGHAIGEDARQETALTVLLLLAAANARARRAPEARLPERLGSRQALDVGRVQ